MSSETVCAGVDGCCAPARYLIRYEDDVGEFPACVEHTAVLRANDPLEYIESVRSLPRAGGTPNG